MKMLITVSVALIHSLMLAQEMPAPAFPEIKMEAPPLALIENARLGLRPILGDRAAATLSEAPPASRPLRRVSHMPIIPPVGGVHYYMRIKKSDESVDYKLLLKIPEVIPAK